MLGDALLHAAVLDVKRLQSVRFRGTYADLLVDRIYQPAASFFLDELYGDRDYTQRDAQFARIAGAIERLFPAQVAGTAATLAQLHAMTEDLDVQMARVWLQQAGLTDSAQRYALAWRAVGRQDERASQLDAVVRLGGELARLTRTPGLRTMLRMMRGPASAAGLSALQRFLEEGFDTFSGMARERGAAERFLETVRDREAALMRLLYQGDLVACETELRRTLGQAP